MDLSNKTDDELRQIAKQAETELRNRIARRTNEVNLRLAHADPFKPEEIRYAARARCNCGAGYAYPKDTGMHGFWRCAVRLLDPSAPSAGHSADLPFAFYEIKSEDQPSAYGATTRPDAPTTGQGYVAGGSA